MSRKEPDMTEIRSAILPLADAMDAVVLTTKDRETDEPRISGIIGVCWDHREILFFRDMDEVDQYANGRGPVEITRREPSHAD